MMDGWKIADVAGLALVGVILGFFTYLMGRSVLEDGLTFAAGSSLAVAMAASVLVHVVIIVGLCTIGVLGLLIYRMAR